jgi:4-amino-4-deoxy-L-arabinose transferase-like glycosyltransferase
VEKMKSLFAFLFATRLFFATQIGVTYDEAYYWSWSKNLALSYYDHPGMVAWLIRISTFIFGDTPLGIRFFPLIFSLLASYAIYIMATKALNKKAGEWAAVAFQATLLIGVGGILITPDMPLMLFWVITLLALFKFIETGEGAWWLLVGASIGLGFTSKYSALFLGVGVALIAVRHLKNPWVYAGGLIALITASPPLIWNAQNNWISFIKQGSRAKLQEFNPLFLLEFIAGQGLLITPFIGILLLYGLFKPRNKYINALLITSAPLFIFLVWQSLFSRVEGNWAAPLLPASIIIASLALHKQWLNMLRLLE